MPIDFKKELPENLIHLEFGESDASTTSQDVLRQVINQIEENNGTSFVSLSSSGEVKYSEQIQQGRKPISDQNEEIVRALFLLHLTQDLGYDPRCIEIECRVEAQAGRRQGPKWVDIAINKPTGERWALIELKTPNVYENERKDAWRGQLFGIAHFVQPRPSFLVYGTLHDNIQSDENSLEKVLRVEIANATEFKNYDDFFKKGEPTDSKLVENYSNPQNPIYIKNGGKGGKALEENFSKRQFSTLQMQLHNVLWGGRSQILTYLIY